MDKYYGNVCELDIIFSFTKAYYILDELLLAGELQESSKKNVLRCISQQDALEDMEVGPFPFSAAYSASVLQACINRRVNGWLALTQRLFPSGRGRGHKDHVEKNGYAVFLSFSIFVFKTGDDLLDGAMHVAQPGDITGHVIINTRDPGVERGSPEAQGKRIYLSLAMFWHDTPSFFADKATVGDMDERDGIRIHTLSGSNEALRAYGQHTRSRSDSRHGQHGRAVCGRRRDGY